MGKRLGRVVAGPLPFVMRALTEVQTALVSVHLLVIKVQRPVTGSAKFVLCTVACTQEDCGLVAGRSGCLACMIDTHIGPVGAIGWG